MNSGADKKPGVGFEFRWVIFTRTILLVIACLSAGIGAMIAPDRAESVSGLLLPMVGLILFSLASLRWYRANMLFHATQLCVDVGVVTGAVYITGGPISPFLFLYVTPVMIAAIFFSRQVALGIAALCATAYSALLTALLRGWILAANGEPLRGVSTFDIVLQGIGLTSAMVLIAVLTSYLAGKLDSHSTSLEKSRRDLLELSQRQQVLVEGIPEGLVTITPEHTVSFMNESAEDLLGMRSERAIGMTFIDVLRSTAKSPDAVTLELNRPFEVELGGMSGGKHRVTLHPRALHDAAGQQSGYLIVLHDVTKLRSIEEQLEMQERMARLLAEKAPQSTDSSSRLRSFVGESPVMKKVFNLIDRVAPSDATVLICGESGTGKELVARAVHLGSGRGNKPFVPVNCSAIPENLIESELFGHKRGSFTGAENDTQGLFRQAEGGTIFLDEIGELPLQMQTKLLRTIQQKAVRPVGGERDIPINVRIVAATNRNLRREIEGGNFREDLFYRLNVININLPPLRERKEDLPLLVNASLKRLVPGDVTPVVPPATMQLLMNYSYPGNVRELENIIERALVLGGEVILPEHLPDSVRTIALDEARPQVAAHGSGTTIIVDDTIQFPLSLDELLANVERRYLEVALVRTNGAKKKAADLLGMNFRSFRYRLQKFGIGSADDDEA